MPYACDNIMAWLQECIEEKYSGLEERGAFAVYILGGEKQYMFYDYDTTNLEEECCGYIQMAMGKNADNGLGEAIMNSVQWNDLMDELREFFETEGSIEVRK